jgi:hypothetical protein
LLDHPGQIRGFHPSIAHRTRDAETRYFRTRARSVDKLDDDFAQFAVLAAGEDLLFHQLQVTILGLKISQPCVGATNIAG